MRILYIKPTYADVRSTQIDEIDKLHAAGHQVDVHFIRIARSRAGQPWWQRAMGLVPALFQTAKLSQTPCRYDKIIVYSSPPLAFAPFIMRKFITQESLTLVHHDIFPANAEVAKLAGPSALFKALGYLQNILTRQANHHQTISAPMRETLRSLLGPEASIELRPLSPAAGLRIISHDENNWRKEQGFQDRFVVMYAGNFGRMYDFEPLLESAQQCSPALAFVFVGCGYYEKLLREAAATNKNIYVFPPQPKVRLTELLCAADLHVIPLRSGAIKVMWPHKLDNLNKLQCTVLCLGFEPNLPKAETISPDALTARLNAFAQKKGS